MSGHARLSPSSSKQWFGCPGSVAATEGIEDHSSNAADWGTDSHAILAKAFELWKGGAVIDHTIWDPENFKDVEMLSESGYTDILDKIEACKPAFNYAMSRKAELKVCSIRSETKVDPFKLTGRDDMEGTCDLAIVSSKELEAADYKSGYIICEPDDPQTLIYLAGLLCQYIPRQGEPWPFETVRSTIIQPRATHPKGPVRSVVWTLPKFFRWIDDVLVPKANATDDPNAPLIAGEEQCRFCLKSGNCRTQTTKMFGDVKVSGPAQAREVLPNVKTQGMSTNELIEISDSSAFITNYLKNIEEEIQRRLHAGEEMPTRELRKALGNRAWKLKDPDEMIKKLQAIRGLKVADVRKYSPKSPAQVLKMDLTEAQRKSVENWIVRPDNGYRVVIKDPTDSPNDLHADVEFSAPANPQPEAPATAPTIDPQLAAMLQL